MNVIIVPCDILNAAMFPLAECNRPLVESLTLTENTTYLRCIGNEVDHLVSDVDSVIIDCSVLIDVTRKFTSN